jgi:hypothetical protein
MVNGSFLVGDAGTERIRMADVIGQIFWFGIPATPLIGFLMVRRSQLSLRWKVVLGIIITGLFAVFFYFMAMAILLRDGLGPG